MACDSIRSAQQTEEERRLEIADALKRLEDALRTRAAKATVGTNGAVVLDGWSDRRGINDACAVRALLSAGSWEMRQALARAEQTSGRKVNMQAVGAGVHSHDGGKTWHSGH